MDLDFLACQDLLCDGQERCNEWISTGHHSRRRRSWICWRRWRFLNQMQRTPCPTQIYKQQFRSRNLPHTNAGREAPTSCHSGDYWSLSYAYLQPPPTIRCDRFGPPPRWPTAPPLPDVPPMCCFQPLFAIPLDLRGSRWRTRTVARRRWWASPRVHARQRRTDQNQAKQNKIRAYTPNVQSLTSPPLDVFSWIGWLRLSHLTVLCN